MIRSAFVVESQLELEDDRAVVLGQAVDDEPWVCQVALGLEDRLKPEWAPLLDVAEPDPVPVGEPCADEPQRLIVHDRFELAVELLAALISLGREVEPEVASRTLAGVADELDRAAVHQHRAVAQLLNGRHVVRDEHDRLTCLTALTEHVHALLGKPGVADREHLVDQHDVRVGLHHHCEGEPHHHSRRVVLQLELRELLELREVEHRVEAPARLALRKAEQDAIEEGVLPRIQLRVETDAQLDERREVARHPHAAGVGCVDARQDLEQSALSGAITADDSEELAAVDVEGDLVERAQMAVLGRAQRMDDPLLERVDTVLRNAKGLGDVPHLDRHGRRGSPVRPGSLFDGEGALHQAIGAPRAGWRGGAGYHPKPAREGRTFPSHKCFQKPIHSRPRWERSLERD